MRRTSIISALLGNSSMPAESSPISLATKSAAPEHKVVVLADTDRLRLLAGEAAQSSLLKQIGLSFALVDSAGNVSEIQSS